MEVPNQNLLWLDEWETFPVHPGDPAKKTNKQKIGNSDGKGGHNSHAMPTETVGLYSTAPMANWLWGFYLYLSKILYSAKDF